MHRGHQALLNKLVEGAHTRHLNSCVLTFEPHPREFFLPNDAPPRIQNIRDKLMALKQYEVDTIAIEEFNQAFSQLSPTEFVQEILMRKLNTKWLLIGDDFCYGAKRAGNFDSLVAAGKQFGFEVSRIPSVLETEERISSSLLRQALEHGDMKRAEQLLGRPFSISGHVLYGKQLGRTLGFPTLNLAVCTRHPNGKPVTSGIFVSQVHGLGNQPLPAVSRFCLISRTLSMTLMSKGFLTFVECLLNQFQPQHHLRVRQRRNQPILNLILRHLNYETASCMLLIWGWCRSYKRIFVS